MVTPAKKIKKPRRVVPMRLVSIAIALAATSRRCHHRGKWSARAGRPARLPVSSTATDRTRSQLMATRDPVRTAMRVQPYRPFHVKLASGRTFRIDYAEFIAVSPNGPEVVIDDDEGMSPIEMLIVVEETMG